MSDSSPNSPDSGNKPPEDLPPPPPPPKPVNLPNPDGFGDINRASKQAKDKAKAEKKKRKKKNQRNHPKDGYEKIRNKKGGGCGCLFALLFLVLLPIGGGFLWINSIKTDLTGEQGYSWITVKEKNVTEAPTEKTAYFGAQVLYEVPETNTEVAFIGGSWWLSGTFHEKVTFRGAQLTLEPGSKFLKGLDVQAAKLDTGNAEISEISGSIMHQTAGD